MYRIVASIISLQQHLDCTFAIIALLQAKGIPVLFPLHANKKVGFRLGSKLGTKDHLVEWHKPKRKPVCMTVLEYAELPEVIMSGS